MNLSVSIPCPITFTLVLNNLKPLLVEVNTTSTKWSARRKCQVTLLWAYQSVTVLPHHFQKITPSKIYSGFMCTNTVSYAFLVCTIYRTNRHAYFIFFHNS